MTHLYLDIETVPAQRPDVLEEIAATKRAELDAAIAGIAPPGNYKKQETIDAWMTDEAPKIAAKLRADFDAEVDAAYRKTGLDGAFGQVCVIGVAVDDAAPIICKGDDWQDEARTLEDFGCLLTGWLEPSQAFNTTVVGHNVSAFDLRFLAQRSIVHGLRPHLTIARAASAKLWESDKVYDTMVQWCGVGSRISLDKLCKALGIKTPKGELDGSKVWDYVKAGRIAEVSDYCCRDVEATRAVHRRMTFARELAEA